MATPGGAVSPDLFAAAAGAARLPLVQMACSPSSSYGVSGCLCNDMQAGLLPLCKLLVQC